MKEHSINQPLNYLSKMLQNEWAKNIILFILIYIFLSFTSFWIKKLINSRVSESNTKLKLKNILNIVFLILTFCILLFIFSNKLTGLTVFLGVAGAGIAFALQEIIASIAGWFAIHFSNFFTVGDRVLLGGMKGDVIDIGLLRTTMMEIGGWVPADQYNGRIVRIANSFVFKEPVINYSGDFPFVWDEVVIPVKHGCDIDKVRALIEKTALVDLKNYEEKAMIKWKKVTERYAIENAKIKNQVYVSANENWVSFSLRYVVDYKSRRLVKDKLFTSILKEIEKDTSIILGGTIIEVVKGEES